MIYFLAPKGLCGVENYISGRWRETNYPELQPMAYEDVFSRQSLPSGTWIFTGVHQLPPAGIRLADNVWQALRDAGQLVLNRPRDLPSRHELLQIMHRAGINEFRSFLPGDTLDDIAYPVFVRLAAEHSGNLSPLLNSRRELESFLRWQRVRGYTAEELMVIEFCDTRDANGEYRKYSAQYVRGEIAARFLHVDTQWMVKHHGSTYRSEWADEEREYLQQNPHRKQIRRIFELARIEYGRIDYGLLHDKIQVWEINTNPTIGGPPVWSNAERTPRWIHELQVPGKRIHYRRFQSMLETIDTVSSPDAKIEITLPPAERETWRREVAAQRRLTRRRECLRRLAEWPPVRLSRDFAKSAFGVAID